jgi:autotransporter translocation and assembly factor TamB
MKRTRRRHPLIVSAIVLAALVAAGLVLKGIVVARIRSAIEASFSFDTIKVVPFPPALVIEGVRSVSTSPSFVAQRVEIRVPFAALFRREKTFRVFIDRPVVRFRDAASATNANLGTAAGPPKTDLPFPAAIESGVVRDGEVLYMGRAGAFSARKIKAAFRQDKGTFSLRLEAAESSFLPPSVKAPLTGRIQVVLEGQGRRIDVRKIDVQGKGILVRAHGVLTNPENPEIDLQARVHAPTAAVAGLFNLPFVWGGQAVGQGRVQRRAGKLDIRADFRSDDFVLNSFAMGTAEGTVAVGGDGGGRVDVVTRKGTNPAETVAIAFGGGKVSGTVEGAHLDPILRFLKVPYPVRSPAWGDFSLENKKLTAHAEFRDDLAPPDAGRYSCRGLVDVTWDGAAAVTVISKRLETSFGIVEADAVLDINRSIKVGIRGEVSDARQAREFTSLLLKDKLTFPEIRGRGQAEVKIFGDFFSPQIKIDFAMAPGGFDRFDVASVSGSVEVAKTEVTGIFKVQDPEMRGDIRLAAGPSGATVRIKAEEASIERVLPPLNIRVPLQGRAAGEFTVFIQGKAVQVAGSFTSEKAVLAGQALTGVQGMMTWSDATNVLAFPDIQASFYGGRILGAGSVGFKSREFDLDLKAEGIDLAALAPATKGRIDLTLKGKGSLDKDAASGTFAARALKFAMVEEVSAAGTVVLTYRNDRLDVKVDGALAPGRSEFQATFGYPLPDGSYQIGLKGKILNSDLLAPWKGVQGELNYLLDIKGGAVSDINGLIDFKGTVFAIPNFPHTFNDFNVLIRIQNNKASIRSLQAKLGGGDVTGSGEIRFGSGGIVLLDIRAEGRNLLLAPIDRIRALVDGSLRLLKDETRFALTGEVVVKNLSWKRELSDKLWFSIGPPPAPKEGKGFFDDLTLDVRVRADGNATIENSLGRIQGRFDLTVTGGINSPVILGDIEGLRGDVTFQDRKFRILRARLSFFNPTAIEPYLDFQGETYIKDYRVTFSLNGLIDRLRPEFTSSPPLPPEDVLALLALGESFKRTYSYDTSSQLGAGSLLSAQLVEDAKIRAERLFSLDRFRIDPCVRGAASAMTPPRTVGKKISRNIMLLYSTNLTSQREEIVRLEWELGKSFSLVGMRDERGRISFDAKIRKRF